MDKPIPEAVRRLLHATEHCLSAADEGVDYAVGRPMLDAMTTLGLLEKTGRGRWAPTDAAEQFVRTLTAAQQPDHIVDATKMVAQQQGQADDEAAAYEQAHRAGESHGRIMAALEQPMQQGQAVAWEYLGTSSLAGPWPTAEWKPCDDPDAARSAGYEVRQKPTQQGGGEVDDTLTLADVAGILGEIAEGFDGGEYTVSDETRRVLIDFASGLSDHPLFAVVGHYFAQNPVAGTAPPSAPVCTCPSGDGSLRWPCPAHPPSAPVGVEGFSEWAAQSIVAVNRATAAANALAQQPAAVDEARATELWDQFRAAGNHEHDALICVLQALATQHQEPTT